MNWDNYNPWRGKKCMIAWGIAGHEGEWVVNIDGYGHGISEKFMERTMSQKLQDLLPKGCRVDNRGSRLEVFGSFQGLASTYIHEKVPTDTLVIALQELGLTVTKVLDEEE